MIRFLCFSVLLSVSIAGISQKFEGYLIGGIQGSQIDGDGWGGYYKGGLKIGPGLVIPGEKMDAVIEMTYSREGARSTFERVPELTDVSLNYLDLALMGDYRAFDLINCYFGVQVAYFLSGKINSFGSESDIAPLLRRVDFLYEIGVGYDLNEKWEVVIRQSRSLINVRNDKGLHLNNNLGVLLKRNF